MRAQQPEFRVIPQFDSGRWKLHLELVRVDPDSKTTMGMDLDSATQARVNETNKAREKARRGSRQQLTTTDRAEAFAQ